MSAYRCPPWFQTFSGRKFDPRRATGADVNIEDIAHSHGNYCRFGGHTKHFYSVAQHVCLVHDHMPKDDVVLRLQALLHDATEAYLGDVVKPLKLLLNDYTVFEKRLEGVIMRRYGLPHQLRPEIKLADLMALATEKRDLMKNGPVWPGLHQVPTWAERITPWAPAVAKEEFLIRFYLICDDNGL